MHLYPTRAVKEPPNVLITQLISASYRPGELYSIQSVESLTIARPSDAGI